MAYDRYPAVDEDFLFPPEVLDALATSTQLRNQVVPMTETQRNNLAGAELWNGRLVLNTTTNRIDRYNGTAWVQMTNEPAGVVKAFAGASAPEFHAICDGSVVARSGVYAALFSVIGTTYNTGGESGTQFRLPNLKGKVVVGVDAAQSEFNNLGEGGGEKTHTLSSAEMPGHQHTGTTGGENANHTHAVDPTDVAPHQHPLPLTDQTVQGGTGATVQKWTASGTQTSDGGGGQAIGASVGVESVAHGHPFTTDAAGGGGAHNNLQPYIAMNYIITL